MKLMGMIQLVQIQENKCADCLFKFESEACWKSCVDHKAFHNEDMCRIGHHQHGPCCLGFVPRKPKRLPKIETYPEGVEYPK